LSLKRICDSSFAMSIVSLPSINASDLPALGERVYMILREAIVDGTLASGAKLSERTLAASLMVSPQPVREALRRLEAEGLAESRPRSGTWVAELSDDRLIEMGRIRAELEGLAAGIAAKRRSPVDQMALQARLIAVHTASASGDEEALAIANAALHDCIHAIAGNKLLTRSLQALKAYHLISTRRILVKENQIAQSLGEHTAITSAIVAGDVETAERLMRAHTLRSIKVAFPDARL
jgi:DNA-binding GntR family transcriptional regulator